MKKTLLTLASALVIFASSAVCTVTAHAQAKAALVQNVDEPARAPFQTSVNLNWTGSAYANIAIPAGKRLVIDFVSLSGAAATTGPFIQPYVFINSSVGGGTSSTYTFILNQSSVAPGQFNSIQQTTIYSDALSVSLAFAGYTPTFLVVTATISGHLINM